MQGLGDDILPDTLALKPELDADNAELFRAFFDLSPSRPVHLGGAGAIPVSEILAYAGVMQVDDVQQFFRRLRAADMEFLNWQAKQAKNGT